MAGRRGVTQRNDRMFKPALTVSLAAATLLCATGAAHAGKDLDAIKARGAVICGVTAGGIAGFMMQDSQGKWVEIGRAHV